jgi:hypothetical protein
VNQASQGLLFFIFRHPVGLEYIVSNQVTEKGQV